MNPKTSMKIEEERRGAGGGRGTRGGGTRGGRGGTRGEGETSGRGGTRGGGRTRGGET